MRLGVFRCLGMDIGAFTCVYALTDMEHADMQRHG